MKNQPLSLIQPDSPGYFWLARALGPRQDVLLLSEELWLTVEPLLDPHRVTGLLFDHIQRGTIETSRRIQFDLAARLARREEATRDWPELASAVLDEFQRREIPCLVMKGWALIPMVYDGRRELREVSDLDLLIPRTHLPAADAALGALGFIIPPQAEVWPGFAHRFSHEAQYVRRCGAHRPMGVDLHWQTLGNPQFWPHVGHDWFARAQQVSLNSRLISAPSTEDLFLHLCGHETMDHARDPVPLLFRLLDLLRMIDLPDYSWQRVMERAQQTSLTGSLRSRIEALQSLWPTAIPPRVMEECRHLPFSPAEKVALQDNLARTNPLRPSPGLRWIPGRGARIKYFCGKLLPSPAFLRAAYHLPPDSSYVRGLLARYGGRLSGCLQSIK